jgi:hypothetical protein
MKTNKEELTMCKENYNGIKNAQELKEAMHQKIQDAETRGGLIATFTILGLYGLYKGYQFVGDQIVKH